MMNILSIGLDRALFDKTSDTFWRVSTYASWFNNYTTIVTTLKIENKKEFYEGNLTVIPTNSRSRFLYPIDILRIALKLENKKFDLVTVQDPFICAISGIFVKLFLRIPLNIQIHSEFFNSKYFRNETIFNRLLYFVGLFTINFADTIRARNKRIARYFKDKRCFYVAAPINQEFLEPVRKMNRDKSLVLAQGRLVKQKNYPLLLEAMEIVKKKFPEVRLEIIGTGEEKDKLEKKAKLLGWLNVKERIKKYEKAGVLVMSSNHEGWGLAALEALSRGCPVVMTDTGCAGEIVIDNVTGYVVPVGNAKAIAEKIILTLNNYDKSLEMAKKGRKLVREDTDLKNIKRQLGDMYENSIFLLQQQNQVEKIRP